jgi:Spy/CpxP family protein refolding chaperone
MKTRITILSIFTVLLFSTSVFAQQGPGMGNPQKNEKVKAMKVEYITAKLELTPSEAQSFWPLYNEFMTKLHDLERARKRKLRASADKELTDDEVNALIKSNFETDQKILDLRMAYDVKFKKVLSIQKVGKLYAAEHQFRHDLLRKMKGGGPPKK